MARKRPYDQYCGLAAALEVIGDRWTPLIVRDLAMGDRRFGELATSLAGIPEDVLAARLKQLQADGVIERAGPARSDGYRLTDHGRRLLPALGALASWGAHHLPDEPRDDQRHPQLALSAMALGFDRAAAEGVDAVVEFDIDGEVARLHVTGGSFAPTTAEPAVTIRTDTTNAYATGRGRRGKPVQVDGSTALAGAVLRMFRFPGRLVSDRSRPQSRGVNPSRHVTRSV